MSAVLMAWMIGMPGGLLVGLGMSRVQMPDNGGTRHHGVLMFGVGITLILISYVVYGLVS